MKKLAMYLLLIGAISLAVTSFAKGGASGYIQPIDELQNVYQQPKKIYDHVEEIPKFPGGEKTMFKWMGDHLKYPLDAIKNKKEGRVVVKFVISSIGKVEDVEVVQGFYPSCDEAAKKLVEDMPNWAPGRQDGKAVPVYFTLPILFKLPQDSATK